MLSFVQEHDQSLDPNLVRLAEAYSIAVAKLGTNPDALPAFSGAAPGADEPKEGPAKVDRLAAANSGSAKANTKDAVQQDAVAAKRKRKARDMSELATQPMQQKAMKKGKQHQQQQGDVESSDSDLDALAASSSRPRGFKVPASALPGLYKTRMQPLGPEYDSDSDDLPALGELLARDSEKLSGGMGSDSAGVMGVGKQKSSKGQRRVGRTVAGPTSAVKAVAKKSRTAAAHPASTEIAKSQPHPVSHNRDGSATASAVAKIDISMGGKTLTGPVKKKPAQEPQLGMRQEGAAGETVQGSNGNAGAARPGKATQEGRKKSLPGRLRKKLAKQRQAIA